MKPSSFDAWVKSRWADHQDIFPHKNVIIAAYGIGGEMGEVQELLHRHIHDLVVEPIEILYELGDLLHYTVRTAQNFGYTFDELIERNGETAQDISHAAILLAASVGRVQELVKKWIRDDADPTEEDRLGKRLAHIVAGVARIALEFGFDLPTVMTVNVGKLTVRGYEKMLDTVKDTIEQQAAA